MFKHLICCDDPSQTPYMGCQDWKSLLNWLFKPGVWTPLITRTEVAKRFFEDGIVYVTLQGRDRSERITWVLKRNKDWKEPV